MDQAAYAKLVDSLVSDLRRIKDDPSGFVPMLEDYKRRYNALAGKVTQKDLNRARVVIEYFNGNIYIRLTRKGLQTLGDVADMTKKAMLLLLLHNQEDLAKVEAVLKKYNLAFKR